MDVESKLLDESLSAQWLAISPAALLQKGQVDIDLSPSEYVPCHLHIAVSGDTHGRRWLWLSEGATERPPTQLVPVREPREAPEFDQLVLGAERDPDVLIAQIRHDQKKPS